ncbi:hypothetical protein KI387_008070, partial [Taxus chinensis]
MIWKSLQYLALRDCKKLLLPDLGEISTLEYLDFGGCCKLQQLPRGTIAQKSLKYLNLLNTTIKQLPEDLDQLKDLEHLYIGSPVLTSLPSSLSNLGELTNLILCGCSNLYDINKYVEKLIHLQRLIIYNSGVSSLPDAIVCMNIKFLDVQHCPTKNEKLEIRGDLGNIPLSSLVIKHCSMSKICISTDRGLFLNLERVDLSNNLHLTANDGLPGNLIRLNLMNCLALKTLTCLSNLASLKYLNISGCYRLETLNVKSLASMEVIKAEECWKLQSIEGVCELQKLSHFQVSTANVKWSGILTSPSSMSTAILCGKTGDNAGFDKMVTTRDIPPLELNEGYPFSMKIENARSDGAILVCLIAYMGSKFRVTLLGHAYTTSCSRSSTTDGGNMYGVHMLMWTKDSDVFKDLKFCKERQLYCNIMPLVPVLEDGLTMDGGLKKGWIVMAKNVQLCKDFIASVFDGSEH